MTVEMSFIASFCLLASTAHSPNGEVIKKYGFFHGWTFLTLVPVISNAVGGILVELVTAYAGGVMKDPDFVVEAMTAGPATASTSEKF
ncbi:UDP-N-acetylglucosamine transporter ROCK1-like [Carex rostrata]